VAGPRARLDAELVRRDLAPSRTAAQALIAAGQVVVAGLAEPKPASQVTRDQAIAVTGEGERYASRGGLKLSGALEDLGVDPAGLVCLDAGAAHGGFTDVLLRAGAAHVIAVDVAYGQLAWTLRTDERVTALERTNVRHLGPADLAGRVPALVVADLSFISLRKVLPALAAVAAPAAALLPMVKPQFEAGPGRVGRGGVVRDPSTWVRAMHDVAAAAADLGFALVGAAPSRAPGPAGNIEFFLHLQRGGSVLDADPDSLITAAADAGRSLRAAT
jgi:23S rRNA (cytidine1920-2'-O)/16S rRNA (cytidine1409-2'-O)-methyltransferase